MLDFNVEALNQCSKHCKKILWLLGMENANPGKSSYQQMGSSP